MSLQLEIINSSSVLYNPSPLFYIKDYYNYIVSICKTIIYDIECDLIIGNCNTMIKKAITININEEHTLVVKGENHGNIKDGIVKTNNGGIYLVRIHNFSNLLQSDIIIDYSIPNLINIDSSKLYNEYFKKCVYISACLYPFYNNKENRHIKTLTTFINTSQSRRRNLLSILGDKHTNINNCFNKEDLMQLYRSSKVLVNIHQDENYHTFEELRCLPALLCGMLVIAEESPLKESIPYSKYIIWISYDNILQKVTDIIENYDMYHKKIFIDSNIKECLENLEKMNYQSLKSKICSVKSI